MPTTPNSRTSMNKLFMSMVRVFKSADNDALADLSDAIDTNAPKDTGMWGRSDNGNHVRNVGIGPADSMSGSGAERMIEHYSPDQQPGDGITQGYTALSEQLAFMNTRMSASEAAIKSIATWLAQQAGVKSFPAADETEKEGDEDDEKKDDEKEDDEAAKSIPTLSVPGLMHSLSNSVSRDTGKVGLQTPPNMATIKKARTSLADILDADDGSCFPAHARMELASIQSAMSNLDGGQMRDSHLNNLIRRASPQAREALMKANITF